MQRIFFSLTLGLGLWSASLQAQEKRVELQLPDARWQGLPTGLVGAFVAPGGKLWFQRTLPPSTSPPTPAQRTKLNEKFRDLLAAEFAQEMPQIGLGEFMLFEPEGRIWFLNWFTRELVGYDGKEYVAESETKLRENNDSLVGRAVSKGALFDGHQNRSVGGKAWFIANINIITYDGKKWETQKIAESERFGFQHQPSLALSPDGKTAVVHSNRTRDLWVYRDGKWQKSECFRDDQPWITQLVLNNSGEGWAMPMSQAQPLHFKIDESGKATELPPEQTLSFGNAQVSKVCALFQDSEGRTIVAAEVIKQGDAAPAAGLLILDAAGNTQLIAGADIAQACRKQTDYSPTPILTSSGQQMWIPGKIMGASPALIDFATRKIVDQLPATRPIMLQAVSDDRVFSSSNAGGSGSKAVMVYTPGGREAPKLDGVQQAIRSWNYSGFEVNEDGSIWTRDTQSNLIRWNGSAWTKVRSPLESNLSYILPGLDGVMLVDCNGRVMLFQEEKELGRGTLLEVMKNHHGLLARAFAPSRMPDRKEYNVGLVADSQGNLWCNQRQTLHVRIGNRWHESIEGLLAAGSQKCDVRYMAAIDDGRKVYLSDFQSRAEGGTSFTGEVKDGKLAFEPSTHVAYPYSRSLSLRDSEGGLWIGSHIYSEGSPRFGGGADYTSGHMAVRLKTAGVADEIKNSGWPQLIDRSGAIWLGNSIGSETGKFNVWRNGKIIQSLTIPGYDSYKSVLMSNAPGSVVVNTVDGLLHLVADGPDYSNYRPAKTYSLLQLQASICQLAMTARGQLVVMTSDVNSPRRNHAVWVFNLPGNP